jgi:hypothetical protein
MSSPPIRVRHLAGHTSNRRQEYSKQAWSAAPLVGDYEVCSRLYAGKPGVSLGYSPLMSHPRFRVKA